MGRHLSKRQKLYRSKRGFINAAYMRGQELSELDRAMHILLHTEDTGYGVRSTKYYGKLAVQAALPHTCQSPTPIILL